MDSFNNDDLDRALLAMPLAVEPLYSVIPSEDVPWLSTFYEFEFLSNHSLLAIAIITHHYICEGVSKYTGEDYTADFFSLQDSCKTAFDSHQKAKNILEARQAPELFDVVDIPVEILGFLRRKRSYEEMMDAVGDMIVRVRSAVAGRDSKEDAAELLQASVENPSDLRELLGPRFAWQVFKLRIDALVWQELHENLSKAEFEALHMNLYDDGRHGDTAFPSIEIERDVCFDRFMDYFLYRVLGITKGRGLLEARIGADDRRYI